MVNDSINKQLHDLYKAMVPSQEELLAEGKALLAELEGDDCDIVKQFKGQPAPDPVAD